MDGTVPKEVIAESAAALRTQDPRWRWLLVATTSTRDFARKQLVAMQTAYVVAVAMIYLAQRVDPTIEAWLLNIWLAEGIANLAFRLLLYAAIFRQSPAEVARRLRWRLVPLLAAVVVSVHWAWTALLMVDTSLGPSTVVMLLAFVMLSVSTMAIAPASPVACIVYLVSLWVPMGVQLLRADWIQAEVFALLVVGLAAVLWISFFIVVNHVRRYLVRSDEVELLLAELHEKNGQLEAMRNQAASELQTRSQFFSSANHDFRQRLHAMKLLTQAALAETPATTAQSPLRRLTGAAEDLESYITDVLDIARLESGAWQPNRAPVDLQDVFQAIELQFEDIAAERPVELRVRTTPVRLHTDQAMLMRILENLVANAIKFTRGRVLVAARRHAGSIAIEVWDQGPGIDPGNERAIFQPFYKDSQAYSDHRREGVGLGLAIVSGYADRLKYPIIVRSRQGRGSVLRVLVPAADLLPDVGQIPRAS